MVFTTKKINGVQCIKISDQTITGVKGPQYLVEKVHTIDPKTHFVKLADKGAEYYEKCSAELQPHMQHLQQEVINKIKE